MSPEGVGGAPGPAPPPRRRRPASLLPCPLLLSLALLLLSRSSAEEEKEPHAVLSDVCASCHANATCQKRDGKDVCICNYGFVGNGRTFCQDIDECEISDICGLGGRCVNTAGSYECYCIEGYQLENGTEPFHSATQKHSCKGVDCGPPPSLPNAYSTPADKTTYGSKVVYTCQPNYVIESGNWTAVCNSRGQWEGADMVCKEIHCGKPLWFPNTDVIWDNTTTVGSIIYYKCKEGFHYFGERNFSQCMVSQKWENITFECKEISCGKPPLIVNSEIKWNRTSRLGSVAEYKCINNSYPTSIKRHSFCTRNGSWEILDLRCEKVKEFVEPSMNNSCLTWRRYYGRTGANKTYHLTMIRMLGNESIKTTDLLITPPTTEEAVNVCLPLRQDANYTVEIIAESINMLLRVRITNPVVVPPYFPEKKVVFSNISIFNDTCIRWQRESERTQLEETYVFHIQGLRWYQKKFCHTMALNFTTDSWTPEVCFYLHPGTNYTVNISSANSNQQSATVYMMTPITEPQSPEVEFITVHGSVPLFSLKKAEERNGPISSYQVIAIPWSSQCDFNCYSLTSLSFFSKGTDSGGYVAAEFPAHVIADNMVDFALGDRLYYGKFYNAPLKKGKDYCIILKTISEWNGVGKQSCVLWAHIKDSSSPPQRMTFVLLGSCAALCSILLLLLCVACAAVHVASADLARRKAGLIPETKIVTQTASLL
ncbi:sushi domain-containing protein 1 isoform X3 [Varanus komodoensis]|uniref:sushi domain-containing protein 1 isoform X3 n=1 Tax=Varanus komodoensis TaxID=61221 RepID=UPI001CF778AF|nr:sushi domain-containing protein 1 isoform X3 [Varanus komodoensis]